MSELERRIERLSPKQRAFLQRRMRQAGASRQPAAERIPRRPAGSARAVLSFSQLRQWVLEQLEPGTSDYNIPVGFRLEGRLDVDALSRALDAVLERHEVLRTTFEPVPAGRHDAEPGVDPAADGVAQVIHPHRPFRLPVADLTALRAVSEAEARRLADAEAGQPFDLEHAPPVRIRLLRLGETRFLLLLTLHHIASDGWSQGVLFRQLGELYRAFAAGVPPRLDEPEIQYADFAIWQRRHLRGRVLEQQLDYWRQQLQGAPPRLELPADRPRSRAPDFRGAQCRRALDRPLAQAMNALARRYGGSLFMVLLAAFKVLLYRMTGEGDLTVGTFIANRNRRAVADLVGFFVNNLALRTRLEPEAGFRRLLARVKEVTLGAYKYQDLPFEKLVDELQPNRDTASTPFFQTMCVLQNASRGPASGGTGHSGLDLEGLESTYQPAAHRRSNFELTLWASEEQKRILLVLEYRIALFDPATVDRVLGHFETLLAAMIADPERPIATLPMLAAGELEQLRCTWRGEPAPVPHGTVHQHFARQAATTPDAVAVEHAGRALSYRQLAAAADHLARRLRALGVGPETLVAVAIERSPELIVALLAVLEAGAAYLPLDPAYPAARRAFMLRDSGARVVVTEERRRPMFAEAGAVLCLDGPQRIPPGSGEPAPETTAAWTAAAGHLAYVIYTSGSTGRPKGVLLEHRSLVHYALDAAREYAIGPRDRALQFASVSFDTSAEEIYPTLLRGATLVLRDDRMLDSVEDFLAGLERQRITLLNLPTAFWHQMTAELEGDDLTLPRDLRLVIIGGEKALGERLASWHRTAGRSARPVRLVNTYGPTEATVVATRWPLGSEPTAAGGDPIDPSSSGQPPAADPPIGRPIANTRAPVLDRARQPVPLGVAGELHLGGPGLARGYLGRPALTAERFVPDPFHPGERLYRSGDLVSYRPDGQLAFRGRTDHQVKVRGFRIELGEIEAALDRHPGVRQSAVLAHRQTAATTSSAATLLLAYVVPPTGAVAPPASELRDFLAATLPDYMLPAAVSVLGALPLTTGGKIDRAALPIPDLDQRPADAEYLPPSTPAEEQLATIWRDLLGCERVGIHDNFFVLGGDSILALRLVGQSRKAGLEVSPRQLFEHPTLEQLARVAVPVAGETGAPAAATPGAGGPAHSVPLAALTPNHFPRAGLDAGDLAEVLDQLGATAAPTADAGNNVEAIDPLTPAQQGMLLYLLLGEATPGTFFERLVCDLDGDLDVAAFEEAWRRVIHHHGALRTLFLWRHYERPLQVTLRAVEPQWHHADLRRLSAETQRGKLAAYLEQRRRRGFDLARAPLLHLALFRLADRRFRFIWTFSHLVLDGWSVELVRNQVFAAYFALRRGEEPPAPPTRPFSDYVAWLASGDSAEAEAYWQRNLGGFEQPTRLAIDHRPVTAATGSGPYGRRQLVLSDQLDRALLAVARRLGITPNVMYQGAWALLLGRYAGGREVVYGGVVSGRPPEFEGVETMVGLMINALPTRVELPGRKPLGAWLQALQTQLAEQRQHETRALEEIRRWIGLERDQPLFEHVITYQNHPIYDPGPGAPEDLAISHTDVDEQTNYPLIVYVIPMAGELRKGVVLRLVYDPRRFDGDAAGRLLGHYRTLLEAFAEDPERRLEDLSLLAGDERRRVLQQAAGAAGGFPHRVCVHQLFEAQARRTPGAMALTVAGRGRQGALTYDQLNCRANRLAHRLRRRGVGPDTLVGIALERSPELIVALLAVLKAGGAYLPLDPGYPGERLAFMLADSAAAIVITRQAMRRRFAAAGAVFCLDDPRSELADESADNPASGVRPTHLAYVIYTSGSTGRPKGVLVAHRSLVHYTLDAARDYAVGARDRVLQFASVSFDTSAEEIYPTLLTGATLVLRDDSMLDSVDDFLAGLERQRITVLNLPTAFWHQMTAELASEDLALPRDLRLVIIGGEKALAEQLASWRRTVAESAHPVLLVNTYGPTEATVVVTRWHLGEDPPIADPPIADPPIGRPIANTHALVLDRAQRPVPAGVPGELHLGGPGLARGYLGRPALTAERFVPDPFHPGERLYRSGDLVSRRSDDQLEFRGRTDHQIKLRGFRIELGEIEAALDRHPRIRQSAVLAHRQTATTGVSASTLLLAYVVPQTGAAVPPPIQELRDFLATTLPDYMLPAAVTALEALPLTTGGKIDRAALPMPDLTRRRSDTEYIPPSTPAEIELAAVWRGVLGRERLGVRDSFFALGGDSILALRLVARSRKAGISFSPRDLFEHPTIAELARHATEVPATGSQTAPEPAVTDRGNGAPGPEVLPESELGPNELDDLFAEIGATE